MSRPGDRTTVEALAAELERMAKSLVEAREHERQALGGLLHDTTLQGLIAAMWQVDALNERAGGSPELEALRASLETLVDQTRAVTRDLRPPALHETGLGAAVDELAQRGEGDPPLRVEVDDRLGGARFAPAIEMLAYRAIQASLRNAREHGGTTARIVLSQDGSRLSATVTDDGAGADLGLADLDDTIRLAKGRFSSSRAGDGGTVVSVELPAG